jgi:hypothetical protein
VEVRVEVSGIIVEVHAEVSGLTWKFVFKHLSVEVRGLVFISGLLYILIITLNYVP